MESLNDLIWTDEDDGDVAASIDDILKYMECLASCIMNPISGCIGGPGWPPEGPGTTNYCSRAC